MMNKYNPAEVYQNLYKMLGYRKIRPTKEQMSLDDFTTKLNHYEYVSITGERINNPAIEVVIMLIAPGSKYATKTGDFKKFLKNLPKKTKDLEVMFVSEEDLTAHVVKQLYEYKRSAPDVYVENYSYKKFNIEYPKHHSIPLHEIADEAEVDEHCRKHTSRVNMEKILTTETPAVWIGLRPGQTVKINRISAVTGEAFAYRYCIK